MSPPRVVLLTGASSGIGAALALELGRRGWKVGLIARRAEELAALAAQIGPQAAAAPADVTDAESLQRAVAELEAKLGPTTLMVANAGIGGPTPGASWSSRMVLKILRVNVEGVVNAFGAVLPGMIARGHGHLAAVSSFAGYRGLPGFGAYNASKSAVTTLCESLRIELVAKGIPVTTVHPGFIRTPMTAPNKFPMPFLMEPDAFARLVADGLERKAAEVNGPWQMAIIMGLARFFPNWLWDAVARKAAPPARPAPETP
jgi:short-subunit dehydrogenase